MGCYQSYYPVSFQSIFTTLCILIDDNNFFRLPFQIFKSVIKSTKTKDPPSSSLHNSYNTTSLSIQSIILVLMMITFQEAKHYYNDELQCATPTIEYLELLLDYQKIIRQGSSLTLKRYVLLSLRMMTEFQGDEYYAYSKDNSDYPTRRNLYFCDRVALKILYQNLYSIVNWENGYY